MTGKRQGRGDPLETFSTLVGSIYDAASTPDHWEVYLRGLAQALNGKSGIFRIIDERAPAVRTNIHYNLDPELQAAHGEYFVKRDAYVEALRNCPGGHVAPGEMLVDQDALRRTEFFADYLQPQDTYHICGGLALRTDDCTIMFGVQRDRRAGPFSQDDADFVSRFVPHIRRATTLGRMLQLAELQSTTAEHALEALAVGVLLLDEQDRVVHANDKAEAILAQELGLKCRGGYLSTSNTSRGRELRDKVAAAQACARPGAPPVPETLLLETTPGQPQLLVFVCPVPPNKPWFEGPWPRVTSAVFLSTLDDAGLLNQEVLRALYGLTATEARLACALAHGAGLPALSQEWQVSRETLRTHLKRILAKTGTGRQADLVRLLNGKPWGLAANRGQNPGRGSESN